MSTATAAPETEGEAKGGGKKKLLLLVLVVLIAAGASWWFLLRPAEGADAPKPGKVVTLEPIQVNLAGGHYLSIGISLQTVEGTEELDGAKALDAVIELYSGLNSDDLVQPKVRNQLKHELLKNVEHRYDDEVMDVYLTQFVTQ
jgi:flagellar protein FliL